MAERQTSKESSIIVDLDEGLENLEGDPKAEWYVRAVTGKPQQIGLAMLFIMTIITVWYFRTYGMAGLIPHWYERNSNSVATQPVKLWLNHDWSLPTYRNETQALHVKTDPIEAAIEASNVKTGEVIRLDDRGGSVPAKWTEIKWRLPDDESRTSVHLTLTPLH